MPLQPHFKILAGVVLALTLLGCRREGSAALGSALEPNARVADRLELRARVSRTSVSPGDTLTVVVVARNVSTALVELDPGRCMPLAYEIRTDGGARVSAWGFGPCGFTDSAPSFRLAPGDSTFVHLRAAAIRWYGATRAERPDAGEPLPAGAYEVVGGLISTRDSTTFVAKATPVPLTVTPSP